MKPIETLVKDSIKNLKPCVHGGEVWDAAGKSGLKRDEIIDFSSSVNPLVLQNGRWRRPKTA